MTELTQFKIFFQGIVKPIINEAVEEAVKKALSSTAASPTHEDEFLNVESSAEFLGVAVQTIYQAKAKGTLKAYKRMGKLKFKRSELTSYLEAGAVQTKKGGKP